MVSRHVGESPLGEDVRVRLGGHRPDLIKPAQHFHGLGRLCFGRIEEAVA